MAVSKTVYFPDYPQLGKTRSGLTIPFAEHEGALFSHVAPLSVEYSSFVFSMDVPKA